eukprot:6218099-Amphidinium_carterae.2
MPSDLVEGEALLATSSNLPCGLVGFRPSVAGPVMVSGSLGTRPLSELSGTLLRFCVLKWLAPGRTLRAWLPASRPLPTGVWHQERAHSAFQVGDTCVRCGEEEVENLEHIVLHCPHWNKERREACMPSHAPVAPACVRLHGLLPAPSPGLLPAHESPLVMKAGVHTVWTDGSGRH